MTNKHKDKVVLGQHIGTGLKIEGTGENTKVNVDMEALADGTSIQVENGKLKANLPTNTPHITAGDLVDGTTTVVENGKIKANIPTSSGGSVQFATEAEIDAGGQANANKAVSAENYHKEIFMQNSLILLGRVANSLKPIDFTDSLNSNTLVISPTFINTDNSYINVKNNDFKSTRNSLLIFNRGANNGHPIKYKTHNFVYGDLINVGRSNTVCVMDNNILIGRVMVADNTENLIVLGNSSHTRTTLQGQVHGQAFVNSSDERLKNKLQKLNTLPNGIEVWKYQYLANGNTQIGWIAQQVEDVLRAKGYDEETIELAIPRERDIDFSATIAKFNAETNSSITLWTKAEARFAEYKLAKARELNVTEETVEEFIANVEAIEEAKRSEWQQSTYDTLQAMQLENYYVYADDIRSINKDSVRDLLGM